MKFAWEDNLPYSIHWDLTNACNFRCKHCASDDLCLREESMMTIEEVRRMVKHLPSDRFVYFNIFGGEPLLRNDLIEVLDVIREGLPLSHLALTTNASFLRKYARALLERNVEIGISIDGISAAVNDAIRGAGTFAQTLDTLCWFLDLRREIDKTNVRSWVAFTITRLSERPEDILQYFEKLGVDWIVFSFLMEQGSARRNPELFLSLGEQIDYLEQIERIKSSCKMQVTTNMNFPMMTLYLNEHCASGLELTYSGCSVASGNFYLRPNGVYTACTATYPHSEAFKSLGLREYSLVEESLEEIQRSDGIKRMLSLKNPGTYPSEEPCRECRFAGSYCDPCWIRSYLGKTEVHALCKELRIRLDAMQVPWRKS
jgi:MoaA/NifB/PqqE/SkfB family radical SAM enzyme